MPKNAKDIVCSGNYCAVVCDNGFRSKKIWRMKCQSQFWTPRAFSPCITCPVIAKSTLDPYIAISQMKYRSNRPFFEFQCSKFTDELLVKNTIVKNSHKIKNLVCSCRKNQEEGSTRENSCRWRFRGQHITEDEIKNIQCKSSDVYEISQNKASFSQIGEFDVIN